MFWLIDYKDYGYVGMNTEEDIKNNPSKIPIEDCFTMDDHMLHFENQINIRRFYWERFDQMIKHFDNFHKILAGNKFYIINKNKKNIKTAKIGSFVYENRSYSFLNSVKEPVNLNQIGPSKLIRKNSGGSCDWYLHKIRIDISELKLPTYYYNRPSIKKERDVFHDYEKTIRFSPESESHIFDQNLAMNVRPLESLSFVFDLFFGRDYRFKPMLETLNKVYDMAIIGHII